MINILNKLDSFTISPAGSELQQIYLRCTILFSCLFFTISTNVGILCHSPYPNKGKWATHLLMFFRLHNRIIVNILLLVNSMPIIIFRPETMQRFPITIFRGIQLLFGPLLKLVCNSIISSWHPTLITSICIAIRHSHFSISNVTIKEKLSSAHKRSSNIPWRLTHWNLCMHQSAQKLYLMWYFPGITSFR